MFANLERWFGENGLSNHRFSILHRGIRDTAELELLQADGAYYRDAICQMLGAAGVTVDAADLYVQRCGIDTVRTKTAFVDWFMQVDSDNWIQPEKLLRVLDECRVKRSDEYAVVLRGADTDYFSTWNRAAMELTVILIDLDD